MRCSEALTLRGAEDVARDSLHPCRRFANLEFRQLESPLNGHSYISGLVHPERALCDV